MLPRKERRRVEEFERGLVDLHPGADQVRDMTAARDARTHTVESLTASISSIVAERQELRAAGAEPAALEENRRRLAAAQSQLSLLLIERYLPAAGAA
jgi:hypothetical protein